MIGQNLNGTRDVRNSLINQSITEIKVDILNICSISNVIVAHFPYPFHPGDVWEIPLCCRKLAKFRFTYQAAFYQMFDSILRGKTLNGRAYDARGIAYIYLFRITSTT